MVVDTSVNDHEFPEHEMPGPSAGQGTNSTAHAEQAISLCGVAVDTRGEGGVAMTVAQEKVYLREAVQQTIELDQVRYLDPSTVPVSRIAQPISSVAAASAEMDPNGRLEADRDARDVAGVHRNMETDEERHPDVTAL